MVLLLRGWKTAPPLSDAADEQDKTAVTYVEKAKRKADKRLRNAGGDVERLHRARKAMKRLRYAAELVEPVDDEMKASPATPSSCKPSWASIKMPLSPPTSSAQSVRQPKERPPKRRSPTEC